MKDLLYAWIITYVLPPSPFRYGLLWLHPLASTIIAQVFSGCRRVVAEGILIGRDCWLCFHTLPHFCNFI